MAEIILTNIFNKKISIEKLLEWLTADIPEDTVLPDIVQNRSTRTDFILYFLNYLREQYKSVLPNAKEVQEKLIEKTISSQEANTTIENDRYFAVADSTFNSSINSDNDSASFKMYHEGQANCQTEMLQTSSETPSRMQHFPPLRFKQNTDLLSPNNVIQQVSPINVQANYHSESPNFSQNRLSGNSNQPILKHLTQPSSPELASLLCANNTSILHPRRSRRSQNESPNSHSDPSSARNSSRTSTPKSSGNISDRKVSKSAQKQNLCLGDFMGMEKGSSEPRSRSSKMKSKRRINPTRLNISGDKESQGKETFGMISRPTMANPKFIEAPSDDNAQEECSFEVERGLLKLERQRQPKSNTTIEIANSEPKLSNKSKSESTVVPRLDLVENAETLDTLATLYSGILRRNLMPNPMTELYFLMTLLTTQYKAANEKDISTQSRVVEGNESSSLSSVRNLETLKDDLGCAELPRDIVADISHDDSMNCTEELKNKGFNERERSFSQSRDCTDNLGDSIPEGKQPLRKILDTAHNCVYFATKVMLNQNYLLSMLDRATLKLLYENQQIATFQPELQKYLHSIYSVKCSQTNRLKQTDSGHSQTSVYFQVDTDNLDTFPSFVAFSLYRKQRDGFYEILNTWEDNHLRPNWSFHQALNRKINGLLTLHDDAVNYCHFAKLFVSQLLISSVQSGKTEDPMNDESLSFLKSLKHLNPEKLLQLKGRLETPLTSIGPVPQPAFPGVQEFYKEFIINAFNWYFHVILETVLVSEIMELNEAQFARSEIEETTVDESTKQNFITCVSSLRVLAKFISLMRSLPFRTAADSPDWLASQIQLRGRVVPPLDLQSCLLDALKNQRLLLTVPWIVQYMAILDPITLRLPYYSNIGEILYRIYRTSNHCDPLANDFNITTQASLFLMFTIGWLFELKNFPRDLYTQWQVNYNEKKLYIFGESKNAGEKNGNTVATNEEISKEIVRYNSCLDELDILDDRAFYECCPFLTEFKILLISGNAILGNSNANRHITPVSSKLSSSSCGVKTKNRQMQLEEAFFHGQPSSVRKTVDFVSERIASSCVKYICNTIAPESKKRNLKEYIKIKDSKIKLLFKHEDGEENLETTAKNSASKKNSLKSDMQMLATTIKEDVKRECSEKIPAMCEARTKKSIESLLADDAVPCVKETCIAIAKRMALDRIEQWIDSHIQESFVKHMNTELKRLLKEEDDHRTDMESRHNANVPCPTEVICMIRNSMWELLEKRGRWGELSKDSVTRTLEGLRQTLTERADLLEYMGKKLYRMSVEFCLLLITHRQDLFTMDIQAKFLNIWKMNNSQVDESEDLFIRIISPRNIELLTSTSDSTVMKIFGRLLKGLLKENLLNIDAMSEQCVALFRQEWPEEVLKQLSQCLKDVVSDYKCSEVYAEEMKYLLGWIATTCEEMEIYD